MSEWVGPLTGPTHSKRPPALDCTNETHIFQPPRSRRPTRTRRPIGPPPSATAAGLRRVALVCAVLAGGLLGAAPASALSQRGHDYSFSFAGGSGEVPLADPGALAVDEASGDVYVSDQDNNRIERFDSSGQFIAAWGWGVGAEPEGKK